MFKRHKDLINSVTFWGKDDGHTWLSSWPVVRNNWPLLFDKRLQAKYAYWAIVDPTQLPLLIRKADAYRGTPRIDGDSEPAREVIHSNVLDNSEELATKFKMMWDDQQLYVFADVTDASVDTGDAVQIYISQGNNATSYKLSRNGAAVAGINYKVKEKSGGYRLEVAIPLVGGVAIQTPIGFDIRVMDGAQSGDVRSWNDKTNEEPSLSTHWGVVTLTGAMKLGNALKGTPMIGAFNDNAWSQAEEITTGTQVEGTNGATAKVKMLWDEGHIYVRAKVTDPILSDLSTNTYEQDSVEVFIDANNHKTASYEDDDGQYRINFKNIASFGDTTRQTGFSSEARITADGYEIEAAIPITGIQLSNDAIIGFDVQVNDDGAGSGSRSSVATWSDSSGKSYQNTSKFGVLHLVAPSNPTTESPTSQPSDSTNVPSVPSNPTASQDKGTIRVEPVTNAKGTATITLQAHDLQAVAQQAENKTIKVDVKLAAGTKEVQVNIPTAQIIQAGKDGIKVVKVDTGLATISFRPELLNQDGNPATGNLLLTVLKVDPSSLSKDVQDRLGGNDVYDFSLSMDGKKISEFKGNDVQVAIPYKLKPGENPGKIAIYFIKDNGQLEVVKNGKYNAATGMVEFKPKHFSKYAPAYVNVTFKDVVLVPWAIEAVEALAARGVVNGISEGTFAPSGEVTRAEFIAMLIRAFDLADASATTELTDVQAGAWYYEAIASAQHLGIVKGKADGSFGVSDRITRQEMAVMTYRVAQVLKVELTQEANSKVFTDQAEISSYAVDAVEAMRQAGIVKGLANGTYAPLGQATRAQAAVLICRLLDLTINTTL